MTVRWGRSSCKECREYRQASDEEDHVFRSGQPAYTVARAGRPVLDPVRPRRLHEQHKRLAFGAMLPLYRRVERVHDGLEPPIAVDPVVLAVRDGLARRFGLLDVLRDADFVREAVDAVREEACGRGVEERFALVDVVVEEAALPVLRI